MSPVPPIILAQAPLRINILTDIAQEAQENYRITVSKCAYDRLRIDVLDTHIESLKELRDAHHNNGRLTFAEMYRLNRLGIWIEQASHDAKDHLRRYQLNLEKQGVSE